MGNIISCLDQRSANYGHGPNLTHHLFLYLQFYWNTYTDSHLFMNCLDIVEDCSQVTRAELHSCDRDHMAYKAKTLFCLAAYEKVGQSLV